MSAFNPRRNAMAVHIIALCAPAMAQSIGDFNGDGSMDLAIGMPHNISLSGSGYTSTYEEGGGVAVIYGFSGRLEPSLTLSRWQTDILHQDVLPGLSREAYDHFGAALAVGDFNDDGYDDLAIGVPGEDIVSNTIDAAGLVSVVYGGYYGLDTTTGIYFSQDNDGLSNTTPWNGENFGSSLAAGDFDHDGIDDLAVGVPDDHDSSGNETGTVEVFFGVAKSGTTASTFGGLSSSGVQTIYQGGNGVTGTREEGEDFGAALATGDFDGDGRDDLAIGVPRDKNGSSRIGGVNVLYGVPNGTAGGPSGGGLDDKGRSNLWNRETSGVDESGADGDEFGAVLVAGRFTNDAYDDLAIGAPCDNIGSGTDAGAVNVLRGSSTGITSSGDVFLSQDSATFLTTAAEEYDNFGAALAAGDFNGNGIDELVIGVPGEDVNSNADVSAGLVHVITWSTGGINSYTELYLTQDVGQLNGSCEDGDRFGSSLIAGLFGGSTIEALAIGVPGENYDSTTTESEGYINVIKGTSSGLGYNTSTSVWGLSRSSIAGQSNAPERFGACLGAYYWY